MKKIEVEGPRRSSFAPPPGTKLDDVLYVEDDDDNYLVAELRLGESYRLLRARDAEEACRAIRLHGRALKAILMDIELRGSELNGIELVRLLRGKLPRARTPPFAAGLPTLTLPILFVTAHGAKYAESELRAMGGDRVITKPVDFGELTLALAQLHLSRFSR